MRKLMWFALGFGTACGLGAYFLWGCSMWLLAAVVLTAALCAVLLGIRLPSVRIPAWILLGVGLGFGWFGAVQQHSLFPLQTWDGQTVSMVITASRYSEKSLYGTSVEGYVSLEGGRHHLLVYLKGEQSVEPGDRLEGSFRIRLTTPGGLKESTYYQGKGIFLIGSQTGELTIHKPEGKPVVFLPARLARAVRQILQQAMPEDAFPFAQALLLGDASLLDYETDTALRVSGIRHVIAVSGLHVAIVYALVAALVGNHRFLTAALGLPALLLFAAMAGFTPSVSRASIMIGLMMLSRMLDREYDAPTELSFACLILLAVNPLMITSVSFQLSVLSVAGILLFQPRIMRKWKPSKNRWFRWIQNTIAVTVSAMTLSLPLSAYYFGTVSLVGIAANLLTIWVIGIVFYGILAVCAVGAFWMPGAAFLGNALAWPVRFILATAKLLARIPMAAVYTQSIYVVAWLALCYLLFGLYLIRKGRLRGYAAVCGAGLCAAMLLSWYVPRRDNCRLTVLDVGQGQSLLFQSKGKSFLVDCGGYSSTGAADTAAETLLSQWVFRLDGILLTHYDSDHMGGVPYLLTRVDADRIYLPYPPEETFLGELSKVWDGEITWPGKGYTISLGNARITVLNGEENKSGNENSMGILFETEDCAILVTGDRDKAGERKLLAAGCVPDVDVLIAGHHGSKNATTGELLDAAKPETVIISVGAGNSYGHPAPQTLERLKEHGCKVLRTDELGTILYRR